VAKPAAPAPFPVGREPEGLFPVYDYLATACLIGLVRTHELLRPIMESAFRRYELSSATFNVLIILRGAGEPLSPHVIAERLMVTRSTVTDLLDSLQDRGLVRRVAHPDDRRMLLVEPTPKAAERLAQLLPGHYRRERQLMSCLSEDEKQALIALCGKIQTHLQTAHPARRSRAGKVSRSGRAADLAMERRA